MRIAVIAAQGRSGQAFVKEALKAGHKIHAGIRQESPFESHPNLTTMECDATDKADVTKLIDGCDAVVSLIGHVKGSDEFVQRDAMKAVVTAMGVAGIKRLVSLTGVGVGTKGDRFESLTRFISKLGSKVGIKRFEDGLAHVAVLEKSDLDWTVLKVLLLTDGEPGRFSLKTKGLAKAPTPRREVARAILKLLKDNSYIREYPIMSRGNSER